ncbi:MAG TPA: redoxin domain-containing protein [Myxococcales bacterium]|nr:redoxin domain-containing protein [Myxococcales bacterium]HIL79805.1 redoxin domain-containing protein [Myxococcales bacterium]
MQVLTVSTDHPEEIRMGRRVHGLQAVMLSDPELAVTDAFGLRNQGYHSAPPRDDAEALPIPASLLVDADGRVLWIDLSENYQRRSKPEVVLAALQDYLD